LLYTDRHRRTVQWRKGRSSQAPVTARFADDRHSEDCAARNVLDRAIGDRYISCRPSFSTRASFHADAMFFDRVGAVDGDLIACGVAVFYAQNKVNRVDSKVGQN
jgi:hypothetical protein